MSLSYRRLKKANDLLEDANARLRLQALVMAKALCAFDDRREYPTASALRTARAVCGYSDLGSPLQLCLPKGSAA